MKGFPIQLQVRRDENVKTATVTCDRFHRLSELEAQEKLANSDNGPSP